MQVQKNASLGKTRIKLSDPDWIQTNDLLLSIPTTTFVAPGLTGICGLDYNFTITGVPRLVSTEPF